jgi:rod shape-determining protein MreC
MQRASDILAEKLPGLTDPNAPKDVEVKTAGADDRPLKPLTPVHPDRFTPGELAPASQLTPGGKPTVVTSSARTNELLNQGAQPPKPKVKRPQGTPDAMTQSGTPLGGKQESFIIPGTATGPDKPLLGPEKAAADKVAAAKASTAVTPARASGEQHQ